MALAKKDLVKEVLEADNELLACLEEKIDVELRGNYLPGGSVSVPINDSEYNERVLKRLKATYQDDDHGWTVELTKGQDYLIFS